MERDDEFKSIIEKQYFYDKGECFSYIDIYNPSLAKRIKSVCDRGLYNYYDLLADSKFTFSFECCCEKRGILLDSFL